MEKKYSTSQLKGGVCNMLFQISAAYAYGLRYGKEPIFSKHDAYEPHKKIDHYENNLFSKLNLVDKINDKDYFIYQEPNFYYESIPYYKDNVKLQGYFQSEEYFSDFKDKICDLFINEEIYNNVYEKHKDILDNNITCSINVRRGDYLKLSHIHPPQNMNYFMKATKKMPKDCFFIVVSDDIEWCKENFPDIPEKFYFSEGQEDYEDLYLMSLCDHNIMSNSTYSWWGAWLNNNTDKKVIAPSKWFGPAKQVNESDILPKEWEKIK